MHKMLQFAGILLLVSPVRADLHFTRTEANAGNAWTGRPLRCRFAFTNQGREAVHIVRVEAACGCLASRLEKESLQPGEKSSFLLDINTLTQPVGQNRWRVQVHYLDGETARRQELTLWANLQSEIKVEPPRLALSSTKAIAHEITITDERALPFRVSQVITSSEHCAATLIATEGNKTRVRFAVKESMPVGKHEEVLCIVTDDPNYRELRVPVTINKRARSGVTASPSSLEMSVAPGQSAPWRLVRLRGEDGKEVVVDKLEVDHPALQCQWQSGPGGMATLKISVDASRVKEEMQGAVRVLLSKPTKSVVTIPVACVVR